MFTVNYLCINFETFNKNCFFIIIDCFLLKKDIFFINLNFILQIVKRTFDLFKILCFSFLKYLKNLNFHFLLIQNLLHY
jgi:hypothetical protein